jgi:hypothetical protein
MKFKALVLAILFLLGIQSTNGQNIIINPSFEIWLDTLGINLPLGWVTSEITFPGSATKSTDAHTGDYAVKLVGSDSIAFAATTTLVIAGNQYDFSGWCKCPSILGGSFVIAWLTLLGQPVGSPTILPIIFSNNYREYTRSLMAPDSSFFIVVTIAALIQSTIYVDDVTLDTVATGIDEVSNNDLKAKQIIIQPNPFTNSTLIHVPKSISSGSSFELNIYDLNGNLVKSISSNNQKLTTNNYYVWTATDNKGLPVSPGVYFIRLYKNNRTYTRQIVLLNK